MANTFSWENEDGWKLLQKWFHFSCEISVTAGGMMSDRRFSIKRGFITHLDPTLIRIRGDGQEHELVLSTTQTERPSFNDVWSGEIAAANPAVKKRFPETVRVESGWETWRFVGPIEIEAGS
jgi:hypothetical protein